MYWKTYIYNSLVGTRLCDDMFMRMEEMGPEGNVTCCVVERGRAAQQPVQAAENRHLALWEVREVTQKLVLEAIKR